jgi:hypothetical protein
MPALTQSPKSKAASVALLERQVGRPVRKLSPRRKAMLLKLAGSWDPDYADRVLKAVQENEQ